jgi:hypothetical protein
LAKGKRKTPTYFSDSRRRSPVAHYETFLRSPKVGESSDSNSLPESENESGYSPPLPTEGGKVVANAPPPVTEPKGERMFHLGEALKIIVSILALIVLVGGILWSAFNIRRDVGDIKENISELRRDDIKSIKRESEDQTRMLKEFLYRTEIKERLESETTKTPKSEKAERGNPR